MEVEDDCIKCIQVFCIFMERVTEREREILKRRDVSYDDLREKLTYPSSPSPLVFQYYANDHEAQLTNHCDASLSELILDDTFSL